jgi:hypothetical protein
MKKLLLRLPAAVLILYALWTAGQALAFKRYVSALPAVPAGPPFEVEGAYHMHTLFSDGRKDVREVAVAAAASGLAFIILTDHGSPNTASLDAQGTISGVQVLAGSEMSTNRGHLVALGFKRPSPATTFSHEAEAAAAEVASLGGFTVIAHPYSKTRWSWGDAPVFDGIEILNGDGLLKNDMPRTILFAPLFLLRPTAALLRLAEPPSNELRKWDELLSRRTVSAFYAADAHFAYKAVFALFHIHVWLDRPLPKPFEEARAAIFTALENGRFFSAVDGAASARGFRADLDGMTLRVLTPFDFGHEIILIKDGRPVRRESGLRADFALDGPGAYRVEVHLRVRTPLHSGVPWIISNPFIIR